MSISAPEQAAGTAATGLWVNQAATGLAGTTTSAAATATAWQTFTDWYTPAAVAEVAEQMATVSLNAQGQVAALMSEYAAQVISALTGGRGIRTPRVPTPEIRKGADPVEVHARPAKAYRVEMWRTGDHDAAVQAAFEREMELLETDLMLAARDAERQSFQALDVKRYRRVLRPELSETGACLLCVAAATRIYTIEDLLPLHVRCKCRTLPIINGQDPADEFNQADLERVYGESGATGRQALSNLRVQVNEHGELGPVLTVAGQKFTGPNDLTGRRDPTSDFDAGRTTEQLQATVDGLVASLARFDSPGVRSRIEDLRRTIAERER